MKKKKQRENPKFRENERNKALERKKKAKALVKFIKEREKPRREPIMTRRYATSILRAVGKAPSKAAIDKLIYAQCGKMPVKRA